MSFFADLTTWALACILFPSLNNIFDLGWAEVETNDTKLTVVGIVLTYFRQRARIVSDLIIYSDMMER